MARRRRERRLVPCCGMNGWQSRWLWQRHSTTPLEPHLRSATRGWWRVPRTTPEDSHQSQRGGSPRGAPSPAGTDARRRLPPGMRPALLVEVQPQGCLERHAVEHLADLAPMVQILDAPVPQMLDSALDFFRRLDLPVAEQVIDVPMISSSSSCPSRAALSEPLMVEQLVEVPTIISYSSLQPTLFGEAFKAFLKDKVQKRVVEQPVDFPVPSSGLQGFSSGQSSTAVPSFERIPERFVEQIVDLSSEERISERIVETSAFPFIQETQFRADFGADHCPFFRGTQFSADCGATRRHFQWRSFSWCFFGLISWGC